MEIKSLTDGVQFFKGATVKKKNVPENAPKDKIEISSEAARKIESEASSKIKSLDEIRKKIDTKFYDSEEVLSKVIQKIIDEVNN